MNVRIQRSTISAIDAARGPTSRDSWVERACRLALRPTAAHQDPQLNQPVHRHTPTGPLTRTQYVNGRKIRYYTCDCGAQVPG